jgi:hypothetical protein
MKRIGRIIACTLTLLSSASTAPTPGPSDLVRAYPGVIAAIDHGSLVMASGTRFAISDGIADKTPAERLKHPDIDDMFAYRYPVRGPLTAPPPDVDPGRIRFQPLFAAMYGDCRKGEVLPHMRAVAWMPRHGGGTLMVTTANGVADHLDAVIAELDQLPAPLIHYLVPSAGTYNCRVVAGTDALSMHAFGAAIDINTDFSDYWRWAGTNATPGGKWRNRIPPQIVAIFERHGFIWGGRWSHFDTMHFEYRPELLSPNPG